MKKLLLLICFAAITNSLQAQLMLYLSSRCNYTFNGTAYAPVDSLKYLYNGVNQRRVYTPTDWSYDTILQYDVSAGRALSGRVLRTYDAGFNKTTEIIEQATGMGGFRPMYKDIYTYNGAGGVTMHEYEEAPTSSSGLQKQYKETWQYNAAGKPSQYLLQLWVAGAYVDDLRKTYTYDGSGKLQQEIHEKHDGTMWENSARVTYTATNPLDTTIFTEAWMSTIWYPFERNIVKYDGVGNQISSEYEMWNAAAWEPTDAIYRVFTQGQLQYVQNNYWDGTSYAPVDRYEYTFLNSDKVLTLVQKTWHSGMYTIRPGDDSSYFHYDATGNVAEQPSTATQWHIYPSPASSHIIISHATAQHYTAMLCDMSGRVVKTHTGSSATGRLDVRNVPAGNYVLVLNAGNNTVRQQIAIAR